MPGIDLTDRSALITASTSGLGLASAEAIARRGANVAICGRDQSRLDSAIEHLESIADGQVIGQSTDITDRDQVATLVDTTVETFGGLDHVVTSAGGVPSGHFHEIESAKWYEAYDGLVMSVVWTIQETYPALDASDQGTIVCITSRTVREVVDGLLLSNAVRRAVIGLVKTISREFAPSIRANAVLPGTIETPRIETLIEAGIEQGMYEDYDAGLANLAGDIPMDRLGQPAELGEVVAFLTSERSRYVNGAAIPVDGGQLRS